MKKNNIMQGFSNALINEGVSKFTPSFKISQSPNFHKLGLCYSIIFLYLYGKKFLIWQRYNLFPI